MELYHALRPIVIFQLIFFYSVINFDKKGLRISRFVLNCAIVSFIGKCVSFFSSVSYGIAHLEEYKTTNPFDPNSSFTTYLLAIPFTVTSIALFVVCFATIIYRQRDLHFLDTLIAIDEILSQFVNFNVIYRDFRSTTIRQILFAVLVVPCVLVIISAIVTPEGDNLLLNFATYGSGTVIILYNGCTVTFLCFSSFIRKRAQLIEEIASKDENFSTIQDFLKLVEAEKLLVKAVHLMNRSVCIRQGSVLIADWCGMTIQIYMLLLSIVFWNKDSFHIIVILLSQITPYLFMVFKSAYVGHQLEFDVSLIAISRV